MVDRCDGCGTLLELPYLISCSFTGPCEWYCKECVDKKKRANDGVE